MSVVMVIEFAAVVAEIHEQSRVSGRQQWLIGLDRTEFREGDSGTFEAVSRSGARLVVPVLSVEVDEAGETWHLVEKPLMVGTEITGRVVPRV